MSINIMSLVWENADVTGTDLLLLLSLADHSGDNGECWPSIDRLASRIRKNRRSVLRSIMNLQKIGYITIVESGKGKLSSRYKINVEVLKDAQNVTFKSGAKVTKRANKRDKSNNQDVQNVTLNVTKQAMKCDTSVTQTIRNHQGTEKEPSINQNTPLPPKGGVSVNMHPCGLPIDVIWKAAFEDFWEFYPKKRGKGAANKAWDKLKGDEKLYHDIIKAVEAWSETEDWEKESGQFIPHPATFLNQRRWEDEIPPPKPINRADPEWMAANDDYTAIGGTRATPEAEYDILAKQHGWDKMDWDEE